MEYRKALVLDPKHAGAYFNLALGFETIGHNPIAIEYYKKAIKVSEDEDQIVDRANKRIAEVYKKTGDFVKAEKYMKKIEGK